MKYHHTKLFRFKTFPFPYWLENLVPGWISLIHWQVSWNRIQFLSLFLLQQTLKNGSSQESFSLIFLTRLLIHFVSSLNSCSLFLVENILIQKAWQFANHNFPTGLYVHFRTLLQIRVLNWIQGPRLWITKMFLLFRFT